MIIAPPANCVRGEHGLWTRKEPAIFFFLSDVLKYIYIYKNSLNNFFIKYSVRRRNLTMLDLYYLSIPKFNFVIKYMCALLTVIKICRKFVRLVVKKI